MGIVGSLLGLVIPALLIWGIVAAVKRGGGHSGAGGSTGSVRTFFQFAVAFGLLVITCTGLIGVLAQFTVESNVLVNDPSGAALNRAFVLVGGPLLALMIVWLRRGIAAEPGMTDTGTATLFITLASILAFSNVLMSTSGILMWAFGLDDFFERRTILSAVVWGAAWAALWVTQTKVMPARRIIPHQALGSLVSAVILLVGSVMVTSSLLEAALGLRVLIAGPTNAVLLRGVALVIVGGLGWAWYWLGHLARESQDTIRLAYVLLAGVGGSLILAVAAASTALYQVLVWLVGDSGGDTAKVFFSGMPVAVSCVIAGVVSWAYHRRLLPPSAQRLEVNRLYDYIISAIGLVATAVGLSIVLVALIEAMTRRALLAGTGPINTLLLAVTLILVGAPVWYTTWRGIQGQPADLEQRSAVRRIYLYLLFGIGGIAAIVCLVVVVYQLFNSQISGSLGTSTLYSMRYALGILLSTAAVAGYHWTVYRGERDTDVLRPGAGKSITLVGPADAEIVHRLEQMTGARVKLWVRTDAPGLAWSVQDVAGIINEAQRGDLLIVQDASGLSAIPVDR